MLRTVIDFLRDPLYLEDPNEDFKHRIVVFLKLLGFALLLSFSVSVLTDSLVEILDLDLGKHASDTLLENYSAIGIAFLVVILAPLLEELFFRGPLIWFKHKPYFKYVFYFSVVVFGGIHLSNFEAFENAYWLAPFLVAPQLILGIFLGFIRVRLGLLWAIALHATYNLVLTIPVLFIKILDISIE